MAVRITDLQLIYGTAGAREKFEHLVTQIVKSEYPAATQVRTVVGDSGIDVYMGEFSVPDGIDVYQAKWFINGVGSSQRGQIRDSFDCIHESAEFTARSWTLCLPVDMTIEETRWFEKWTTKQTDIEIRKPWDGTKLTALLLAAKNRGIKEAFFKEEYLTQIRETHATVERLAREVDERLPKAAQVSLEVLFQGMHIEHTHVLDDERAVVEMSFVFHVHNRGKHAISNFHVVTDIVCPQPSRIVRKAEFSPLSEHRNNPFDQGILPTLHKEAKVYIGIIVRRGWPFIRQLTTVLPELQMTCRVISENYVGENEPVDIKSKIDWAQLTEEVNRPE